MLFNHSYEFTTVLFFDNAFFCYLPKQEDKHCSPNVVYILLWQMINIFLAKVWHIFI